MKNNDDRYNRQLYVLGVEAQQRISNGNVLVVGLNGLGIEVSKNLLLAGVHSVTLQETQKTTWHDLSSQFYLTEKDVGKNRAVACLPQLKALNTTAIIKVVDAVTDSFDNFDVVIFAGNVASLKKQNELCRRANAKFIAADSRGLFGSIFCDCGSDFIIFDADGREPATAVIKTIPKDHGVISLVEPIYPDIDSTLVIEGVEGMENISITGFEGGDTIKIDVDITAFGSYKFGGRVREIKSTQVKHYKSLTNSIPDVGSPHWYMYPAFTALANFEEKHGRPPRSYNDQDANEIVQQVKTLMVDLYNKEATESQLRAFKMLSYTARGNLSPIASYLGGIVAQEALKALTGKFTPLDQWMFLDASSCLPYDDLLPTESDTQPLGTRYDGQIAVFGLEYQKKLAATNAFIVGAGALGCEYIKLLCMMGVGVGTGSIHITDMDSIELSNLSRQFLFRDHHIGQLKSKVAASVARELNKEATIIDYSQKVAQQTEHVFTDDFWEQMDLVLNALDNVEARKYVDSKCLFHQLPLLEAGTMGIIGATQTIVPHVTETYRVPHEQDDVIPMCTLKSFPYNITHTIAWAKDLFEFHFTKTSTLVNEQDTVKNTYQDCIVWALQLFDQLFNQAIVYQLKMYPVDMMEQNLPFWSGTKQAPTPILFNKTNSTHLEFVRSAANLRAFMYDILIEQDVNFDIKNCFVHWSNPLRVHQFEKDDDTNYHIDFITAASNLRAKNYSIIEADRLTTKRIAGKIIPAMVTTTAAVTGFAALEAYKLIHGYKDINCYWNSQLVLSRPTCTLFRPLPAPSRQISGKVFNIWYQLEIERQSTMQDVVNKIKEKFPFNVLQITTGANAEVILYNCYDKDIMMPHLLEKHNLLQKYVSMHVFVSDTNANVLQLPVIKYHAQ